MYSDQEKRKKSYSIRALCDPRNITMVSVAYTRVDRGLERKIRVRIETKVKEKRIDFESNRNGSNPNPRDERARDLPGLRATAAAGARDVLASSLAGIHGTEEPLARRSGTLGSRARGAREHGSVHGRLDGGALTLWRARAPASKPRRRRPARSARPPWPVAVAAMQWREKGGANDLGFGGRRIIGF